MKEMRSYASDLVEKVKNSEASYRHDNMTQKKCPECGSNLLEIKRKARKAFSLQQSFLQIQAESVVHQQCPLSEMP